MLQPKKVNNRKTKKTVRKWIAIICCSLVLLILAGVGAFLYFNRTMHLISALALAKATTPGSQMLAKELEKSGVAFSSVTQSGDWYDIELPNSAKVLFSTRKSIQEQIASLQLVTSRLTIEGKKFSILDFRFAKPVIVF
ncbi:MAG TPA: hypothetical protein VLF68_01550 [Candidatus Saccharimonadales bacterium]|nr:hypothetical protein [Candidatus Saccharimonadales bacterium]